MKPFLIIDSDLYAMVESTLYAGIEIPLSFSLSLSLGNPTYLYLIKIHLREKKSDVEDDFGVFLNAQHNTIIIQKGCFFFSFEESNPFAILEISWSFDTIDNL